MSCRLNNRSRPAAQPQRLGLPLCTHERVPVKPKMTSSSIHHWQRGRALPSAVQPLHRASEEEGGAEEGREGKQEAKQQTKSILDKLKQYVRSCRLLPHQIWHMFLSRELLWSQLFVSATILQSGSLLNASSPNSSLQDACTISCLIVNLMKGGEKKFYL